MRTYKLTKFNENTGKFPVKLGKMAPGAYLGVSQGIVWS